MLASVVQVDAVARTNTDYYTKPEYHMRQYLSLFIYNCQEIFF